MARQVRLLEQLADAGMGFARAVGRRAVEPADTGESADPAEQAIAFGHVARAVRQTIGLEVKLRADRLAGAPDPIADAATRRQLLLLKELAEIGLAVAKAPANPVAVPIFLKVARAVRRTVGLAVALREGRQAASVGGAPAPGPAGGAAANPAGEESPEIPSEVGGDIASTLGETLDAFNEYYRFLRVPVAEAVALIFKTLGVPVEPGPGPTGDGAEPDPAPAGTGVATGPERAPSRPAAPPSGQPGAGNRGPP